MIRYREQYKLDNFYHGINYKHFVKNKNKT